MRKTLAMFLVVSFLTINCKTIESTRTGGRFTPEVKHGVHLIVQRKDEPQVNGELIAVKQSSLLLKDSESGVDVNIDIGNVMTITVMKESNFSKGAGIGFLSGAGLGAIIGFASGDDPGGFMTYTAGQKALILGGFFGVVFGLLGGLSGAISGIDKTIQFEGVSDTEIKNTLEELRKKARVTDFQ